MIGVGICSRPQPSWAWNPQTWGWDSGPAPSHRAQCAVRAGGSPACPRLPGACGCGAPGGQRGRGQLRPASLLDAEWAVPGGASGKLVSLPGPPPRAQRVPGGGAGSGVGGGAGGAFPVVVRVARSQWRCGWRCRRPCGRWCGRAESPAEPSGLRFERWPAGVFCRLCFWGGHSIFDRQP